MRIANIRCEVFVDQQALPEYQTTIDAHNASCHIAAAAGKPYEIKVTCDPSVSQHRMTATLYIDGRTSAAGCKWVNSSQETVFKGVVTGDTLLPFQFAPLRPQQEENEDEDDEGFTHDVAAVSTIRLDVWRVECHGSYRSYAAETPGPSKLSLGEKEMKKGGQMRDTLTSFGEAVKLPKEEVSAGGYRARTERIGAAPHASFLFRYASPGILEAQGIITERAAEESEGRTAGRGAAGGSEVPKAKQDESVKQEPGTRKRFTREENVFIDLSGPSKRRFTKEDNVVIDLTDE